MTWTLTATPEGWSATLGDRSVSVVGPPPAALVEVLENVAALLDEEELVPPSSRPAPPSRPAMEEGAAPLRDRQDAPLTPAQRAKRYRQEKARREAERRVQRDGSSRSVTAERDAGAPIVTEPVTRPVTIVTEPVTLAVTERDGSRDALAGAVSDPSSLSSGKSPEKQEKEKTQSESARVTIVTKIVTEPVTSPVTIVTAETDLDQPFPDWGQARFEALKISMGPTTVDPVLTWKGFVADVAKKRAARKPAPLDAPSWQAWLAREWGFAKRDAAKTHASPRASSRLPTTQNDATWAQDPTGGFFTHGQKDPKDGDG